MQATGARRRSRTRKASSSPYRVPGVTLVHFSASQKPLSTAHHPYVHGHHCNCGIITRMYPQSFSIQMMVRCTHTLTIPSRDNTSAVSPPIVVRSYDLRHTKCLCVYLKLCSITCQWVDVAETRVALVWSGLVWSGLVWSGLVWSGLVWSGLVWSGLVWSGLVWSGLVWSGLVWVCTYGGYALRTCTCTRHCISHVMHIGMYIYSCTSGEQPLPFPLPGADGDMQ